jgi:hypothetical protein
MSDEISDILLPDMRSPVDDGRATPKDERRPVRRTRLALITVAVLGMLIVVSLGGFALMWDGGDPGGLTLVIPEGAAATLEYPTLDSAIEVPTDLVFERGEVLVIRNEDTAANRAGPWVLAAGETLRMTFDTPGEYYYLCSVDESESVTITVLAGE